jgi:hypothetical protein
MDAVLEWIGRHIHGEWATVRRAPLLTGTVLLVGGALEYLALRLAFGARLRLLHGQIESLSAAARKASGQLVDYKDRLGGTPFEVAAELEWLRRQLGFRDAKLSRPRRQLTDGQVEAFKAKVAQLLSADQRFGAEWSVSISATPDTESARFAAQLFHLFRQLELGCQMDVLGRIRADEAGIVFYSPDLSQDYEFGKIAEIFEAIGLKISRSVDEGSPLETYIFISPDKVS